ncbi:hypothetical protein DEU56DRAFT_756781 [Suillus clintonianus]|uniref:uncharacterized protein n=1 Tax=Suillus clintonianus TaxID=1904413 RepID=UPI001B860205|nr:uncharacterized protein DEU56DRAFT_756781 [Suillus clintonianus]KAG2135157.1 hypothetical protein DEU56DRAFT_756781 [Suillus clintonianus]
MHQQGIGRNQLPRHFSWAVDYDRKLAGAIVEVHFTLVHHGIGRSKNHAMIDFWTGGLTNETPAGAAWPSLKFNRPSTKFGTKTKYEDIDFDTDFDTEDIFRVSDVREEPETQEYITFHKKKIKIVVELSGNTATEDNHEAPFFRKLTRGPQGSDFWSYERCQVFFGLMPYLTTCLQLTDIGKSSLINHAFGMEKAVLDRGKKATLQQFKISLVVGDLSLFLNISSTLRAITESGTEAFLTLKRDGKLGNSGKLATHPFVESPSSSF